MDFTKGNSEVRVPIPHEDSYIYCKIPAYQLSELNFYIHRNVKIDVRKDNRKVTVYCIETTEPARFQITSAKGIPIIRGICELPKDAIAGLETLLKRKPSYFVYDRERNLTLSDKAINDWKDFPNLILKHGLFFTDYC